MDGLSECPVGVLDVTHDGRITAVNRTAAALLETDRETLVDSDVTETFPHSVERTLPRTFGEAGSVSSAAFEEYYPGPERWFAVTVAPDDDRVRVYVEDVTDRREREQ